MPWILHIETSTDVCSVCIAANGKIIAKKESAIERSHASTLTVFIEELMADLRRRNENLNAVAVSMGPGSYTGLRIGVSVAKGICYGANIPLIAIPTLEAMCLGVLQYNGRIGEKDLLVPMIDARRMEVYLAVYDTLLNQIENTSAKIINEDSFRDLITDQNIFLFGTGAEKLKETLKHEHIHFLDGIALSSEFMIGMALQRYNENKFEDLAYFEPYYLKDFIATTPKKNQLQT